MLQSLLISLYSTDIKEIALYWCYATVTSLVTYLKLVRATFSIFLLVIPYFYAIGSNLDKETIFFSKGWKGEKKLKRVQCRSAQLSLINENRKLIIPL